MGILSDTREISGIYFDDDEGSCYTSETGHEIKAYPEPGVFNDIVYFAVHNNEGNIIARVPAWKVTVVYAI